MISSRSADTDYLKDNPDGVADYSFVETTARIAIYDDKLSAPRVISIDPAPTNDFIERLASSIYSLAIEKGGKLPYTAIREVSENFIHANFKEIVVTILDEGNTIRFSDQGPGINNKDKAQLPGFTSATEPMKHYIRGVGSGLPIVKEYLSFTNGTITIEDNLNQGAVVTISLGKPTPPKPYASSQTDTFPSGLIPLLSKREKEMLLLFGNESILGVTEISKLMDIGVSSVSSTLNKLEQAGLVEKLPNRKRMITELGSKIVISLR